MKILQIIFLNSWVKTAFFILLCFFGTYFAIKYFSESLIATINWRSKGFWTAVAIAVPSAFLFPTMLNGFLFLKITQTADNTRKTQKLLQKQNELLQKILEQQTKNNL